jgi:hypothetical protein
VKLSSSVAPKKKLPLIVVFGAGLLGMSTWTVGFWLKSVAVASRPLVKWVSPVTPDSLAVQLLPAVSAVNWEL